MKRLSLVLLSTLFVFAALRVPLHAQGALSPDLAEHGYADMIVFNAKVVSMDDSGVNSNVGTIYQALAVKGDRIIALGTNDKIRALVGPSTKAIDAGGQFVMPGIIESHAHLYGDRRISQQLGLKSPDRGVSITVRAGKDIQSTRARLQQRVKEEVAKLKPGDWILINLTGNPEEGVSVDTVWAWVTYDVVASKDVMDAVAPDNPVLVQSGPRGNLNSKGFDVGEEFVPHFKAFVRQSIGDAYVDQIDRGFVGVAAMQSLAWDIWWRKASTSVAAEVIRRDLEMAAAHGVTTFSSRVPHPRILDGFVALDREKKLPVRFASLMEVHRKPADPEATRQFYKMTGNLTGLGSDYLWIHGVASEFWDSLYPFACLGPDFKAAPNIKDREQCPKPGELWYDTLQNALEAGWRLAGIHGVGSHGVRIFIQMVENVMKKTGMTVEDVRKLGLTIEHAEVLGTKRDVMEGLAKYGITVSVGPGFMSTKDAYVKDYGSEIEQFVVPVKSLLDAGVKVVGQIHSYHQIGYLWKRLMTRDLDDGTPVNKKEAVDRVTVLKMWTNWTAGYVRKSDELGSLQVGRMADFLMLDKDYLTIPIDEIPLIRPQMTVMGGQIRYLGADFAARVGMQPVGYQYPQGYQPWNKFDVYGD